MDDAAVTLVVLAAAVALFVWNRLPIAVVALVVALALWATDIVSLERALAGSAIRPSCSSRRCS